MEGEPTTGAAASLNVQEAYSATEQHTEQEHTASLCHTA